MLPKLPSNRKFGFLFATIFLLLAVYDFFKNDTLFVFYLALFLSLLFFTATIKNSEFLTPLNKAWFLFGQALGKIVSPVVLGIIFFTLLTPIGLIAKALGRDELKLRRPDCSSYWVEPIGSNSDAESFKNQF